MPFSGSKDECNVHDGSQVLATCVLRLKSENFARKVSLGCCGTSTT